MLVPEPVTQSLVTVTMNLKQFRVLHVDRHVVLLEEIAGTFVQHYAILLCLALTRDVSFQLQLHVLVVA